MKQMLLIIGCSDPLMWYRKLIGKVVPFDGIWPESGYRSREESGYSNVVRFEDAMPIYLVGES